MKTMKTLNKVIAMMMMLTITSVTPAMAGGWRTSNMDRGGSHFDKVDRALNNKHFDKHVYRPDVKTCTFKVSRHDSHKKVVAKVENMKGVMDTKWNPRTRELTVRYDANKTSVRNIKHFMA